MISLVGLAVCLKQEKVRFMAALEAQLEWWHQGSGLIITFSDLTYVLHNLCYINIS